MAPPSKELRLVQRLVSRQRGAWREFVHQYQGLVYKRVQRTASQCMTELCTADLEDICAEVFASLLANDLASLRRFQGRSSLATWLSVIAHRICLRQISRLPVDRIRQHDEFKPDVEDNVFQQQADLLAGLIAKEDHQRIRKTIEQLGKGDQQILRLYYGEELGYSEISNRMGISINTVGPKLHRAQKRLRKLLRWV